MENMRKVKVRKLLRGFREEVKDLPILVTRRDKPICVIEEVK
jgi:hypothetical protein